MEASRRGKEDRDTVEHSVHASQEGQDANAGTRSDVREAVRDDLRVDPSRTPAVEEIVDDLVFMTTQEVAARLRVHHKTAQNMLRTGELRGFKVGGEWRTRKDWFREFCAAAYRRRQMPPGLGPFAGMEDED